MNDPTMMMGMAIRRYRQLFLYQITKMVMETATNIVAIPSVSGLTVEIAT
jgi:hypothetical protein